MTNTDESRGGATARDPNDRVAGGDGKTYTVAELKARVTQPYPQVFVVKEILVGSVDALAVMLERVRELADAAPDPAFAMIVDLVDSQGKVPAEYRQAIPKMLNMVGAKHIGIALYSNPVVRAASRFIANRIGLNVTIHPSCDEAITAVRRLLAGAQRPS